MFVKLPAVYVLVWCSITVICPPTQAPSHLSSDTAMDMTVSTSSTFSTSASPSEDKVQGLVDPGQPCQLYTFNFENETMSASLTCKCAATALTFVSLARRGVPRVIIASIPFPYLPGPPRSNSYLDGILTGPSAGSSHEPAMDAVVSV